MTDATSIERRRTERVPLAVAVELRDARGFSLCSSKDLSAGGAFFDRAIPYEVGSRVQVTFSLPGDDEPIRCEGQVVNIPDPSSFGMGVQFFNLKPADARRLEEFTRSLPQATG